jgi:hypothetical protein
MRLITSLSSRRTGFNTGQIHVGFMVDTVTWDRFISEWFGFLFGKIITHYSIRCLIFILLLSEGQSGATCEPANKAMRNFGNKSTFTIILFLKGLMNTPISFFSGWQCLYNNEGWTDWNFESRLMNSKGWPLAGMPISVYSKCKCGIQYFPH